MPEKTIESILKELVMKFESNKSYLEESTMGKLVLEQASLAIRQLIKEELEKRLPKSKNEDWHNTGLDLGSCQEYRCSDEAEGYNQALTDCKAAIAEYLGEGER